VIMVLAGPIPAVKPIGTWSDSRAARAGACLCVLGICGARMGHTDSGGTSMPITVNHV